MSQRAPEINLRQQNIIRALLNAHGRCTLSDLAEQTGLSSRVVRYNMDIVRSWLISNDVEFINRPGYGIEVVASYEKKSNLLAMINQLDDCDIILSRQQRVRIILLYLLTSNAPVSAREISEVEAFSRSTLFKDVNEVESWLAKYHIVLIRRSAMGLWIDGSEESRRFALTRLLREELGKEYWYAFFRDFKTPSRLILANISGSFSRFIQDLDLKLAWRLIQYIEENIGFSISVVSQIEIMVYLAIAINALNSGSTVTGDLDKEVIGSNEYAISQAVAYQIEKRYPQKVNEKEKEIIAALIKSCKLEPPDSPDWQGDTAKYVSSPGSEKLAQELINICSMRLHPMLKIDELLLNELANHLDYAIFRLKHHIPIRNPYLDQLREKHSQVVRIVESSVFIVENEIQNIIPPEEIGYITMYLLSALERLRTEDDSRLTAVIANDGIRSKSSLLKSRLRVEFPNLNVTQVINTFEGIPEGKINGELVISTVPIENSSLPVIEVTPFLELDDIKKIQRWVAERIQAKRRRQPETLDQQNTLVDLIRLPHVVFEQRMDDWRDIVKCASQPLIVSGAIQPRYVDAMVDLIDHHGFYMYMGSGVLLLHAKPTDGVNQLCVSLLKLAQPFHFEDNRIPDIDLIFVLGATDDISHLTALFQLNELIQFPLFMQAVRESASPRDIIQVLWQWLPKLPENA
jgi:transcriptional antiterminator